jgi:hypothetical protein
MRSVPINAIGSAICWIGNVSVIPTASSASAIWGSAPSSRNVARFSLTACSVVVDSVVVDSVVVDRVLLASSSAASHSATRVTGLVGRVATVASHGNSTSIWRLFRSIGFNAVAKSIPRVHSSPCERSNIHPECRVKTIVTIVSFPRRSVRLSFVPAVRSDNGWRRHSPGGYPLAVTHDAHRRRYIRRLPGSQRGQAVLRSDRRSRSGCTGQGLRPQRLNVGLRCSP